LLVWSRDSYTGIFLVLFPWIYVLQPNLFIFSSLLRISPVPFPWLTLSG
jgi:hypothetical protein